MIKSEQYCGRTNQDIFYYLSKILDEIYFLNKSKTKKDLDGILRNIENLFIGIQTNILFVSVHIIKKDLQENKIYTEEINKIILNLNDNLDKINFSKNDLWVLPDLGKIKWARINESNRYIKNTFDEVIKLISNDLNFNENVWGYKPNLNKNPIKSKEYVDKLQSMMKNDYSDSRMVLYDILRRSNSYYRCSITELRDALDHIVKSLFLDEEKAIRDIICAQEHIRRAAVESIHDYVLSKLSGLELVRELVPEFLVKIP